MCVCLIAPIFHRFSNKTLLPLMLFMMHFGSHTHMQHVCDELMHNVTAVLLKEVCDDLCIEPDLHPMDGEVSTGASSNTHRGARLDIAARNSF